jgi:uncharacterized protein
VSIIPSAALDDRLGFLGTAGSGKTYAAGTAVECLLDRKSRVVIIDPLGVWWGLRLKPDGKTPSPYDVAIFGGPHGDLPLNEAAGALIGETAATMAESCIVDLSELGTKASERRFMTQFLETLYRKSTKQPMHLVVDEADLFAPQKPQKGEETLLGLMEQIVRRGRVRGFIPWVITQRPAVINKNVLSQVGGLIAFKLTASQDRDALDAWIEGQADKKEGKAIKDALPAMKVGQGVVWLPTKGILRTVQFPFKETFDSSRTPKRGEKMERAATLKPLDLGALKERLSMVEAETKANDPRVLKAEIAALKKELLAKPATKVVAHVVSDLWAAEKRGFEQDAAKFAPAADRAFKQSVAAALGATRGTIEEAVKDLLREIDATIKSTLAEAAPPSKGVEFAPTAPQTRPVAQQTPRLMQRVPPPAGGGGYNRPQMKILRSLAMWRALGHDEPTREMVAAIAGYVPSSGGFNNLIGSLGTIGAIGRPRPGRVSLLAEGVEVMGKDEGRDMLISTLSYPQRKIVAVLIDDSMKTREFVAEQSGYVASSGGFNNLIGSLGTVGIIVKPQPGYVELSAWVQELLTGHRERLAVFDFQPSRQTA